MYAIIATGGKQYKVAEGDIINVEKLGLEADQTVTFEAVITVNDGDVKVGGNVNATVLGDVKGKKVIVYKYKAKKNERKKQGHRQPFTAVKIEKIVL